MSKTELSSQEREVIASVGMERDALWRYLVARESGAGANKGDLLVALSWAIGRLIGERQITELEQGMEMINLANEEMVTAMCDYHNMLQYPDEYAARVAKNKGRLQ